MPSADELFRSHFQSQDIDRQLNQARTPLAPTALASPYGIGSDQGPGEGPSAPTIQDLIRGGATQTQLEQFMRDPAAMPGPGIQTPQVARLVQNTLARIDAMPDSPVKAAWLRAARLNPSAVGQAYRTPQSPSPYA